MNALLNGVTKENFEEGWFWLKQDMVATNGKKLPKGTMVYAELASDYIEDNYKYFDDLIMLTDDDDNAVFLNKNNELDVLEKGEDIAKLEKELDRPDEILDACKRKAVLHPERSCIDNARELYNNIKNNYDKETLLSKLGIGTAMFTIAGLTLTLLYDNLLIKALGIVVTVFMGGFLLGADNFRKKKEAHIEAWKDIVYDKLDALAETNLKKSETEKRQITAEQSKESIMNYFKGGSECDIVGIEKKIVESPKQEISTDIFSTIEEKYGCLSLQRTVK